MRALTPGMRHSLLTAMLGGLLALSGGSALAANQAPPQVIELAPPAPRVLTLDLTRDANDIWDRIRRGFAMPDLDSDLVLQQQIFYLNRPAFLKRVLERGGRYLYHIVDELEARGLPTELALLPMVESAYNPLAYSRAHASGLWQFIPSTGRNYKLVQDNWVDERRDILASTSAALDYLKTIYDMQGDWHLALASYNWGEGAVARAVQRNLDAGLPAEYAQLRMPDETRNYVPKLQALKNIIAQPELFGLTLPYLPNEPYFEMVDAPAGIDLATAARLAEVPLEEFIALNPGFNRPVILEAGRTLVVPSGKAARFRSNLASHAAGRPDWSLYRLKPGEKVEAVAARLQIPVAALRQINNLSDKAKPGAGTELLIPERGDLQGALNAQRLISGRSAVELPPTGLRR